MSDRNNKIIEGGSSTMKIDQSTRCPGDVVQEGAGSSINNRRTSGNKRQTDDDDAGQNRHTGNKKIRVDADNPDKILDDQRRGRVELDKEQRDNVLRFILACNIHMTAVITNIIDRNNPIFRNVHVSQQITSIFCTLHNCLRQESLSTGSLRTTMADKDHSVMTGGEEIGKKSHQHLLKVVVDIATSFGLKYSKPASDDTNHWYGTISPLLCFINMFKVRMNELRIGHGSMVSKKRDGSTFTFSMSQYGLYNVHHPLLEGVTIPPEKKSGMAQSLGPMTSLICLARADNDQKYSKRWRAAVKRDLAFLPEIESIIEACCGKRAEHVKGLYSIIADIILITTSRESKRASFPACMMYKMLDEKK